VPSIIEFHTERLWLRQWRLADREPLAAMHADPRVMEFFPALLDRRKSDAMAERCEAHITERGWGLWAVETMAKGEFIGFVGLHTVPAELPFFPGVEIGWRLARGHWGKGFATEAARGAIRVAFELLGLPEIVSFTAVCNERSRAVMRRLQMREAGTFQHPAVPEDSRLRQHILYRLLRDVLFPSPPATANLQRSALGARSFQ
jgi:RimJ/RimL family protein N-acetyltransferase